MFQKYFLKTRKYTVNLIFSYYKKGKQMKKNILLILLLQICASSCAFTNTDTLIQREVSTKSIFNSSRVEVEDKIGITFSNYYDYLLDGNRYSGVCYDRYAFLFKNNMLTNIVEYGEMERVWTEAFIDHHNDLPYKDNLQVIHERLSLLPSYAQKIEDEKSNGINADNISDGVAAGLMLVLSAPIIPVLIYESSKEPGGVKIDWESEIVGHSYDDVIKKLGRPMSKRDYKGGNKLLSYKQQYFWIPHYIGIKNDQVVWVLHQSAELYNNR